MAPKEPQRVSNDFLVDYEIYNDVLASNGKKYVWTQPFTNICESRGLSFDIPLYLPETS